MPLDAAMLELPCLGNSPGNWRASHALSKPSARKSLYSPQKRLLFSFGYLTYLARQMLCLGRHRRSDKGNYRWSLYKVLFLERYPQSLRSPMKCGLPNDHRTFLNIIAQGYFIIIESHFAYPLEKVYSKNYPCATNPYWTFL